MHILGAQRSEQMSSAAAPAQPLEQPQKPGEGKKPAPKQRPKGGAAPQPASAAEKAQGPGFIVELVEGREAFAALEKEWNAALAKGPRDEPMLRHEWLRAHVENFTPGAPLRVLLARAVGELHAALVLVERREQGADTCGLPLTTWELPASDHSQRGGALLGPRGAEALEALWERLASMPGWDRLRLRDLPEGAPEWRLRALAEKAGFPCGLWTSLHSPFLTLPPGKGEGRMAQVEEAVDSKFRANLRRRRRRLAEQGEVRYAHVDGKDAAQLDAGLADFFDIEASGWKGRGKSAIALDPRLVGFYTQIARDAARRGALQLAFIECGGKRVAGHLALQHAGGFYLVKVGYDETYREFSPGQQLARDAIASACALGLREFDFLGPDMDWKDDWEPKLRTHTWLTIFRPTRAGRLVYGARFVAWPVAKALAERVRERFGR
jgi:CelD/BcsL family acetyltransferase involved in cellulose biosynthesis